MESGNLETLQFDGGSLVFDFTKTISNRKTESAIEYLGRYEDILTWSQQAGILTPHQHTFLNTKAEENQQRAKAEYKRAVRLREILYILFSNLAAGHTPQADITSAFNKEL